MEQLRLEASAAGEAAAASEAEVVRLRQARLDTGLELEVVQGRVGEVLGQLEELRSALADAEARNRELGEAAADAAAQAEAAAEEVGELMAHSRRQEAIIGEMEAELEGLREADDARRREADAAAAQQLQEQRQQQQEDAAALESLARCASLRRPFCSSLGGTAWIQGSRVEGSFKP